jgi:heat shock protein HtpX
VLLTRNPEELAQALIKISNDPEPLEAANRATAHLYIINPLHSNSAGKFFAGLFDTHPPIPDRVKALKEMEGKV